MNNALNKSVRHHLSLGLLGLLALSIGSPAARAGLTFTVDVLRYNQGNNYRFYTPLETNSTAPAAPLGTYFISSPFYSLQQPTNGSWREIEVSTNGVNTLAGVENPYNDFNSVMQQITNGTWTILFTNATTTNLYTFTVSAPSITSNMLPATIITFPANGELNLTNQPTFTWQGPTNWAGSGYAFVYDYYVNNYGYIFSEYAPLPASQTSWTIPVAIPSGKNCSIQLNFTTNHTTPVFVATTPLSTNSSHQAISGWVAASTMETGDGVSFAITNPPATGNALVAHYTFDNSGNLGQDSSGHGYDLNYNGGSGVTSTGTAKAGSGAAQFDGSSFFGYTTTPSNILSTLAGDFTLSFWIKTTQNDGNENGAGWAGTGLVSADVPGQQYDLIPAALDGGQIGFNTGPYDDTLNTSIDINDGNYHHVAVTRNQTTGEKQIYIDGVLNTSQLATLNPLSDPRSLAIGCKIDASQPDPINLSPSQYFNGLLDDIQVYSGVLSSNVVAQLYANPGSTAAVSGGGHTLVAHYAFDDRGNYGLDSSGQGNDINCGSGWGTNLSEVITNDAVAGGGALQFFGYSSIVPCGQAFTNWTNTLAGSFSVSAWIKTTNVIGNDGDALSDYNGQSIIYADNNQLGATPVALTGSKVAFRTTDPDGNDDTLHSLQSVTTGNYVHIVSTRDQITGVKKIYINGTLDSSDIASTEFLSGAEYVSIGGELFSAYQGRVDDVQIYAGVLAASEVAYLHEHPGTSVADVSGNSQDFNVALGTTNLNWATSGDTSWFVETTNTYNGAPSAAQSGSVTNNQTSVLATTVTGPGTLTFYWQNTSLNNLYLEFDLDGIPDVLWGFTAWTQAGPFTIPAGQHTLSWTVHANGDNDPTAAGYLAQVSYVAITAPVITLNPFDQTNYPGYNVALLAAATSANTNNAITWQWFKVGNPAPIPNATTALFIPTNSGTVGVAGSYYAVASTLSGPVNTTTAAVSFVSAPLPPDWSRAFKSPFSPVDNTQITKDYYYGCFVDPNGNLYAAAEFGGNTTVGTSNLNSGSGGDAAGLVKQSPAGAPLWAVGITNNGGGSANALCVAPAPGGGAYLAGNYSGNNWLGTHPLTDAGNGDMFLARFDANGSNVWWKTFGGTNSDFMTLNALAADPAGNVTLSGLLGAGPVSIGSSNYTVVGQEGIVIQLDQTGAVRWSQLLPGEWGEYLTGSAGRLYVSINPTTGNGTTNVVIGGVTNLTDRTWAIACLNETNGQAIWVRGVGARFDSANGNPYSSGLIDDVPRLAVSGTNVFLTGVAYDASASFGAITVNFGDLRGQYFARYDTNGNAQVATHYGSVTTTPNAAVADASGNVYVSGTFDTFSIFGNHMIAAPVATRPFNGIFSQAFLAKMDRNGNPLWAREAVASTFGTVNFLGIALATDGVWASGWCLSGYYPETVPVVFGTNNVISSGRAVYGGPGGSLNFIWYPAGVLAKITDSASAALPVTLLNPQTAGSNFQFQFLSQAGLSHAVQYRTNLVAGSGWQTYSTVTGDGTLKTIPIPLSVFSPSRQGFVRVATQ